MSTSIEALPNIAAQQTVKNMNSVDNPSQVPVDSMNTIMNEIKQTGAGTIPLPQRDIPNNTVQHLSRDQEVRPTHIKAEPQEDYIKEYENLEEIRKKAVKEEQVNTYDEYVPYGFAAGLYVMLQLPQVRSINKKNVPGLFTSEGDALLSYNILLGVVLASSLYVVNKHVL